VVADVDRDFRRACRWRRRYYQNRTN